MVCYANGGKLSLICDICYLKTGSFDLFKPLTVIHMQGCTLSFTRTTRLQKGVCYNWFHEIALCDFRDYSS